MILLAYTYYVYVPSLSLGLEYQGYQHYKTHHLFGNAKELQARDQEKRNMCKRVGITLIDVPYWWDEKKTR